MTIIQSENIMPPLCFNCGLTQVAYGGRACSACNKLLGLKNVPSTSEICSVEEKKVKRLEAKAANAVMIAALPKPSQEELNCVFARVLKIFDSALQVIKNDNPGKVILVSIAVTSKNVHPGTGIRLGNTIEQELAQASLYSLKKKCANLVKLVEVGGETYFRNPTRLEWVNIGPPGVLLYDAGNCKHTCEFVEMFMQMIILIRACTKEKIRLLQFTPGNGGLKAGAPFKVGYCFIVCDEDGNPLLGLVNRKDINPGLKNISHAPATPQTTTTTPATATKSTSTMTSTRGCRVRKLTNYFAAKRSANSDNDDDDNNNSDDGDNNDEENNVETNNDNE
jgi:hypothetical protein